MVRKQLYLEEAQDEALKRRARELGVSEAEVVRRALDAALRPGVASPLLRGKRELLKEFFDNADAIAESHPFPEGFRFRRQELYEEDDRFRRWDDPER